MNDIACMILVAFGVLFELIGCIGLVRMPDVYNRLQAATKCVTIGTCFILAGVWVQVGLLSASGLKAGICMVFILLTSPAAAHAIARAAHRSGIPLGEGAVLDRYKEDREGAERHGND